MAKLGELGKIITGNTPKTSEIENYSSNDICFVKPSDILENDITYIDNSEYYLAEKARDKARILPPKSILVTCIGIIGKVAINQIECAFNQQINAIIPFTGKCIPNYLAYAIQHKKSEMQDMANAAVVPILNKSQFSDIEINLTSLDKQLKIVSILDKVSNLIFLRKQQLDKLDELVKARFVEMFGTYSQRSIKAGTILNEMRNGLSPSSSGRYYAKVLTLSAITQGAFDASAWKDGYFDDCPPNDKRICATDFYICRGNGNKALVGAGVYSPEDRFDLVFPDTVIAARVDGKSVLLPYLFIAWKMPNIREQIEKNARTTNGTYKINQQVISNIELVVPPLSMQNEFTKLVLQSNKQKLTIQQSLDKLEVLKKSLMQEYFG